MSVSRRDTLRTLVGVGGMTALRAFAAGLPAFSFLRSPQALAQAVERTRRRTLTPQVLILSTSSDGDPLNANVPGCYVDADIAHPAAASMAPTTLSLCGQSHVAAKPWASLPQHVLDRTMFLHHATNTAVHSDEPQVLGSFQTGNAQPQALAAMANGLHSALGTVQAAPIALGAARASERLRYQGGMQPAWAPLTLAKALTDPTGPLSAWQTTRERDVDAFSAWLKGTGAGLQRSFLDQFAKTRQETRAEAEWILTELQAVQDNSLKAQLTVALVLARLKWAPVLTVHMGFGGDNHVDADLAGEAASHVASIDALKTMYAQMQNAGLEQSVTFATLNVFGRQLHKATSRHGRGHLAHHHVMVGIGPHIRGGVYGGVQRLGDDFAALPIDSKTGQGMVEGDITLLDSLPSAGKTLGTALGVDAAALQAAIPNGTVLRPAVLGAAG